MHVGRNRELKVHLLGHAGRLRLDIPIVVCGAEAINFASGKWNAVLLMPVYISNLHPPLHLSTMSRYPQADRVRGILGIRFLWYPRADCPGESA